VDDFSLRSVPPPRLGCLGRRAGPAPGMAGAGNDRSIPRAHDGRASTGAALGAGYAKRESITGSAPGETEPK
jgi:hypothetical protein